MVERNVPIWRLGCIALVAVALIQNTQATDKCKTGCHGTPSTFKYLVGTTYKYNYDGKIDLTLSSAEGQVTSTEVKANVLLTQGPDCNQILRLQNVQILAQGGKKFGTIPDLDKPIRFNFNDGIIDDSICAEDGDNQNSLNIKRAIASAFQANLKSGHETDVFGLCPTEVTTSQEGAILVIHKSRHLNKCAYRENIKQDFLATTFNKHSEIKSSPILTADYNAKLKIKNGILDSAQVTENYLYMPFSVGRNGAKAQVVAKLNLQGTSKDNPATKVSKPKSIIFENPHPTNVPKGGSNVNNILNAVKEVSKTIDIVVNENTAKEFINLVKILRVSNKDDVLTVYNQVKSGAGFSDKVAAKKIFLDALLRAGNGDTIEVVLELLKNKELNELEQKLVYLGLSLARHATENSLVTASSLLNQANLPREAYLGIGNLAGKYCRQHNCDNAEAVNKLTAQLVKKLGDNKAGNRQEENEMIWVLKSLRNFHHLNDNILAKITQIAQDKKAPSRLRVAALETYLADPCKDKLRDSALGILQDIQQDSEVRIKAYLAIVKCPNAKIGNAIKDLLEKEPSYQVGGFIVSHIRNIRASANPDKDLAREFLGFVNLPTKFPIDFRKWSYNGEFSYAVDTLGLASATEANVIYSPESFLPRSSSLNITAEVFGHNINFLEIETRQENLDRLVAHYFGPRGVLRSLSLHGWKEKEKSLKDIYNNLRQKVEKSLRSRRDVSRAEIDKIGKEVSIKESTLEKDLDLDLSVKTFGSEMLFLNLNDEGKRYTPEAIIDRLVEGLNKGLDNLKNFEETLRYNAIFLDAEVDYPTSLGFPLRLAVEGVANIQLKTKGSIDLRALLNRPQETAVKVALIPSINVEVSGRMTLDAMVVENGIKVVSTLHSATGGDMNLELSNNGENVQIKYNVPVEKQTLVSANHEIVQHIRELGARESNTPLKFAQNKDFSICVDQAKDFIGLEFCGEYSGPNLSGKQIPVLPFPLSGDANVKVEIIKHDVKEYVFRTVNSNQRTNFGGEVELAMIGKNGQKKASASLVAQMAPERFVKAEFQSPKYNAVAEARITDTEQEKSVLGRLKYAANEWYGKAGVSVSGNKVEAIYKPIFEYKVPNGEVSKMKNIQGQIIVKRTDPNTVEYVFDNVQVEIPNSNKKIMIKGKLGKEDKKLTGDMTVSDGQHNANLKGLFQIQPDVFRINGELKNTFNPQANFNVKAELKLSENKRDLNLQVIHGADLASKTQILTVTSSIYKKYKSAQDYEFGTKNLITYPAVGLDVKLEFETTPKSLDYDVNVQYQDIKVGSELDFKYDQKVKHGDFDYQLELEVYGLDNRAELKSSRKVEGLESKIDNTLEVNGKKFEVKGKVRHVFKPQNVDFKADLVVVVPTHNAPFKVLSVFKQDINDLDLAQKVTSGNEVIVDAFLKANKNGNAHGNIKVNIKNVLVINGQVIAQKGVGNADILIDAQAMKRQVKAETKFNVQESKKCDVLFTLYPIFEQDKNKKIVLDTQNSRDKNSVESKNVLDFMGHKLELNARAKRSGEYMNGNQNGEVEIILPNEQYFQGKFNREIKTVNNVINGQGIIALEHRKNKNTPGHKMSLKGTAKNTNMKDHTLDLEYNLACDDSNGRSFNADLNIKRIPKGENVHMEVKNKMSGSVLNHPLQFEFVGDCDKKGAFDYNSKTTYGPKGLFIIKGKYDVTGENKPYSGEFDVELKTPSKAVSSLKVGASGSLRKPQAPGDYVEYNGAYHLFIDDDGSNPDAIIDVKGEGSVKASDKDGQIKKTLKYGKKEPITMAMGYSRHQDKENKQINANAALQYGAGKNIKGDISITKMPGHEYKMTADLILPTEAHKNNKLTVHTKRSEDGQSVKSEIELESDGKKYTLDSDIKRTESESHIDIKMRNPENKLGQVYVKVTRSGDKIHGGEIKIVNEVKNFLLEGNLEVNVESVENFKIKGNVHCPPKLNKISFEANNKAGTDGRKIEVNIKSGDKNLLSGSSSYQAREEAGKYIIEGSGSFKVKEEAKTGNFKYICNRLSMEKNGEQGIEITFDAGMGNRAIDAELKITNKQFRILNSYCEEKKECAHIEIDSKTNVNNLHNFNQVLEIAVDLRKLGLSHEFGLKAVTTRKDYQVEHTVDVHFQNLENSKYQYSLYVHPKNAGVSLTTPKRIIALEMKADYPKTLLRDGGKVSGEIVFYLDKKNQPSKKTSLTANANINVPKRSVEGEAKFNHPGMQRPLSITVKSNLKGDRKNQDYSAETVFDIFAQPAQKLVVSYKSEGHIDNKVSVKESLVIKSSGLGVDIQGSGEYVLDREAYTLERKNKLVYHVGNSKYENQLAMKLSRSQANVLIRVMNVDMLRLNSKMNINKEQQVIDTEISSYKNEPVVSHLEVKNFNTVKYEVGQKKHPNNKLVMSSGFILGQIADIRADLITKGGKSNMFHASLKLDDSNFLKPDYGVDSKRIQETMKEIRNYITDYLTGLKSVGKEWSNEARKEVTELGELAKKSAPNMKPLVDYYGSELSKIREEIVTDKTIKEISEFLKSIFGTLANALTSVFNKFSELVEASVHVVKVAFSKVVETFEKDLLPLLQSIASRVASVVAKVADTVLDIVLGYFAKLSEIIEKHQPEIKQMMTTLTEAAQELGRVVMKAYGNVSTLVREQLKRIYNEIKALPIFEELKNQYEEFIKHGIPNADGIIQMMREMMNTITDLIPPEAEEVKILLTNIQTYIEKKLKNEKVDDLAELEKIAKSAIVVVRRMVLFITEGKPALQWQNVDLSIFSPDILTRLPKLVAARFSPLSHLLQEESKGYLQFLLSLVTSPRRLFAPFPFEAIIVDGQHIFTFGGKHLTFKGQCSYLLARDAVNGRFTVAGTFSNGVLESITLADEKDTVTVKKGGQVTFNNAAGDLPVRKPNLAAFRDYAMVTLETDAGVRVECIPELTACVVRLSGFYHGQVRGMLGSATNDPFNDFTMGNGKITEKEAEFGNSYKMGASCPAISIIPAVTGNDNPVCTELFSWKSSLRLCYPFVNTDNYKQACNQGMAAGNKEIERLIAGSYVGACFERNIPILMPEHLVSCRNGDKPTEIGDKFSVKLPGKMADIVILLDTVKRNEGLYKELVQPLVADISKDLKSKGVSDVNFHLITYGGENHWPSHVTVNGKLQFKEKAPAVKFTEAPKHEIIKTENDKINRLLEVLYDTYRSVRLALGLNLQARTYTEGLNYPFRAQAVKSIIAVTSEPCETGKLYAIQKLRTLFFNNKQIRLNLITPFDSLSAKDAKTTKDVIGFNNLNVFTLSQGKKHPEGTPELQKDLVYDDFCVDFTINNGGNVFVADNFESAKGEKKTYISVAAHNIVDQLTGIEEGLDCECKMVSPWTARNICKDVYSKDRTAKRTTKG